MTSPYNRPLLVEGSCTGVGDMVVSSATIDSLLKEKEQYAPPKEFTARALVKDDSLYREAEKDFEKFWAGQAEGLH